MVLGLVSPPQIGGRAKNFVKNEKIQSCSKLPKMARKLVKNYFWTFQPSPKKFGGVQNFLLKIKKIKVVQNCLKWRENWSKIIFESLPPSPPPPNKKRTIGAEKKIWSKKKEKKSCSNLPEMARTFVRNDFFIQMSIEEQTQTCKSLSGI